MTRVADTATAHFARACCLLALPGLLSAATPTGTLGIFDGQTDVGQGTPRGKAAYSAASNTYTLASNGANTWYHVDDFQFVWKKTSVDMTLTADISFPPPAYTHEPNPHRKGILMFRQTLDAGAPYVALGAHGSGMTALQYRAARGANTEDIELNIDAPQTVRIEKRGEVFTLYLSMKGEPLHPVGASVSLHLTEPFYVGLGALSHDTDTVDKVEFRHVVLEPTAPVSNLWPLLYSTLQTIQTEDQFRRAMLIRSVPGLMQSANWAPGGNSIYVLEDHRLLEIPYLSPEAGGVPRNVTPPGLADCSGNFGLSPDGKSIAFLAQRHGAGDIIGPAALKSMAFGDGLIRTLAEFQGSRDSFAMYGWGDNNHVAFISYQLPTQRNTDNQ